MFIIGIVMHELGHLVGGIVAGYRLYFIEVFGVTLLKDHKGLKLNYVRKSPVGQCIMFHENIGKNPIPMIVGGLAANLLLALLGIIVFFMSNAILVKTVFLLVFISNLSMVLMNIFGSDFSDGKTLLEVHGSVMASRMYNEIMFLYYVIGNKMWYIEDLKKAEQIKEEITRDLEVSGNDYTNNGTLRQELEMLFKTIKEQERNGFIRENI